MHYMPITNDDMKRMLLFQDAVFPLLDLKKKNKNTLRFDISFNFEILATDNQNYSLHFFLQQFQRIAYLIHKLYICIIHVI